jgi:hypothetical protein
MDKKIKIYLDTPISSTGRGVGYYAQFLGEALSKLPEVEFANENPDIIHYPYFDLFYPTLPLIKKTPSVVTIHDLTPLVLSRRYPKGIKGSINLLRQYLALRSVKAIITDSQNSKSDIVRLLQFSPKKVFVTPLAVDPVYSKSVLSPDHKKIKATYKLPERFVLCVSAGPNPNKNLPALARVTQRLDIPLVLVGKGLLQDIKEPVHPELKDLLEIRKYSHIVFPGFVPSKDLNAIYRLATVYCQPSLYEGFGLPLLEAMTAGCLITSSNTSSLPEIYHSGALAFNPNDEAEMEAVIGKALSLSPSERAGQIKSGLKRSRDFSWDNTAKATLKVYKEVLCL